MGKKRRNEEGVALNGTAHVPSDGPVAKKAKTKQIVAETSMADVEPGTENQLSNKEAKAAKAARKAIKRAKKEAELATVKTPEDANQVEDDSAPKQEEEAAASLSKAEKKAEKERKRAAKAARKAAKSESSSSVAISANSSSTDGHSNGASVKTQEPSILSNGVLSGYKEAPELTVLPQADIDEYLSSKQITVTDEFATAATIRRPITNFSYIPSLDKEERAPFKSFASPTPIQAAAWPYLLDGRDVVGVAETGSGKTLAFGVPCMRYIKSLPKSERKGVKAVMVSPTRELALQIHEQLEKLATPAGLLSVCIYGGVPKYEQKAKIQKAHIVVATPGRLNDLLDEGSADLSGAGYVVLDEADRMLDVGFEEAIRKIISSTNAKRQTLMFTATWPPSIRELAATFMKKPVKIIIGDNPDGELRANTRIEQIVEVVQPNDKNFRLLQLLKEHQSGKKKNDRILVFCLYKKEAARVEEFLAYKGFSVAGIHGDLSQEKRVSSLDKFKKGEVALLVATDVAARGLDIPAVKVVINVTFPLTAEDYVHRIGRTGRAGQDGLAITLFTEHDKGKSGE
jgi:ATP-dependent RNA helicase DBP3